MISYQKGDNQMNLDSIKKLLASSEITQNVFLLFGDEVFLKNHYKNKLIERLADTMCPDMNNFYFSEKNYKLSEVDDAIETLPFMAESKMLYFKNSAIFKLDSRSGAKQEYRDYWDRRLKNIPQGVYIIFDEADVDKRSSLYKKISKDGGAFEFNFLDEREMTRWTVNLFKTMGKTISPHDAQYLAQICSGGMTAVKNEAIKLSAYTLDRTDIRLSDIKAVVTPTVENKIFETIDAVMEKNTDAALRKLSDLFYLKESEVKILSLIASTADKLMNTKLLLLDGLSQTEIMMQLGLKSPFIAKKYIENSKKCSFEDLKRIISGCSETDMQLKSTSIDKKSLLELLIADISSKLD